MSTLKVRCTLISSFVKSEQELIRNKVPGKNTAAALSLTVKHAFYFMGYLQSKLCLRCISKFSSQ